MAQTAHGDVVLPRLLKLVHDPDYPVGKNLVETLALVKTYREHPELAPLRIPSNQPSHRQLRQLQDEARLKYIQEVKAAIKTKRGKARKTTLETLETLKKQLASAS